MRRTAMLAALALPAAGCLNLYGDISDLEDQSPIDESGRPSDLASQDYPIGIAFGGSGGQGLDLTVIARSPAGVANLRFDGAGVLSSSGVQLGTDFGDLNAGSTVIAGLPARFDGDDSIAVAAPLTAGGGRILLFDADSSQSDQSRLTTGEVPVAVAMGETDAIDANGQQGPDIVAAGGTELTLFINYPGGEDKRTCTLPAEVVSVALLDVEQSPGDEVVVATADGAIRVLTGTTLDVANGAGCFDFGQLYVVDAPNGETDFGAHMLAADLDGSGLLDLVAASPATGQVFVYPDISADVRDGSDPLLSPPLVLSGDGGFGAAIAAGDLDEDGAPELAVGAPQTAVDGAPEAGEVQVFRAAGGEATLLVTLQLAQAGAGDLFGRVLAVGRFDDADDLLAVGSKGDVYVYFRHPFATDNDPRVR